MLRRRAAVQSPPIEGQSMKIVMMICCLLLAGSCAAQTVEDLIAKNLAARGGAKKLRAIQTLSMTGTISFGDASSPLTVKVRRPNQIREDFKIDGADMTRAYDGSAGWETK